MNVLESEGPAPLHALTRTDPDEGAWPEPKVLGEGLWRMLERAFLWLERAVDRGLPNALNPVAQTGAVAVVTFLVAVLSGVTLLIWYDTSVHSAWSSVQAMGESRFLAGMVRSLHRYSSDGAMLFVMLHATRLFLQRRYGGTRKLAWITGIILVVSLWGIGWSGYWLVWDTRAQQVALGTAKMLDILPIFADPMSRSFLTDAGVNTLLFFVVFFAHMLLPLGMGIPLWLHITRLSRARFLTKAPLAGAIIGTLVLLSVIVPADFASAARMTVVPTASGMDAWFLLPLYLTDRLGAGALWAVLLFGTTLLISVPYWMQRGRAVAAQVNTSACNNCQLCYQDCPYDAIRMVPRTDGRNFAFQAQIDPARCVGCGICAGSCDPGAIGLPPLPVQASRRQVERWIDEDLRAGKDPFAAFVCTSSAGGALKIDDDGRCAQLPGYRVFQVPCAGWVHMLTVERAVKKGAKGVLIAGCGPGEAMYREGGKWTELRLTGERLPALRHDKVDREKIRFVRMDAGNVRGLLREAEKLARGAGREAGHRPLWAQVAVGAALVLALPGLIAWGSRTAYAGPPPATELVVSFKHPGQSGQRCRILSEEEKQAMPPHMRQDKVCERGRADVWLKVEVDSKVVLERAYQPKGLSRDGNSIAVERMAIAPGEHQVKVSIGDSGEPGHYAIEDARDVVVREGHRQVVLFDRVSGFTWAGGTDDSTAHPARDPRH